MSKNLERFTNGYGHSVTSWALQTRTWFLLKNMPKPLRATANHLLQPALFLAVPSTSSESIALFGESPVSKAYNRTRWMRSSHWWISVCKKTAQPLRQSRADLRAVTFDHPCTARIALDRIKWKIGSDVHERESIVVRHLKSFWAASPQHKFW